MTDLYLEHTIFSNKLNKKPQDVRNIIPFIEQTFKYLSFYEFKELYTNGKTIKMYNIKIYVKKKKLKIRVDEEESLYFYYTVEFLSKDFSELFHQLNDILFGLNVKFRINNLVYKDILLNTLINSKNFHCKFKQKYLGTVDILEKNIKLKRVFNRINIKDIIFRNKIKNNKIIPFTRQEELININSKTKTNEDITNTNSVILTQENVTEEITENITEEITEEITIEDVKEDSIIFTFDELENSLTLTKEFEYIEKEFNELFK